MNNFTGFPTVHKEVREIRQMARNVGGKGFSDLDETEVEELINSHQEELTEEELLEMHEATDNESEDEDEQEEQKLTAGYLRENLQIIEKVIRNLMEKDPNMNRRLPCKRGTEESILPYRELHKSLLSQAKQSLITDYIRPSTHQSTDASTSASQSQPSRNQKIPQLLHPHHSNYIPQSSPRSLSSASHQFIVFKVINKKKNHNNVQLCHVWERNPIFPISVYITHFYITCGFLAT